MADPVSWDALRAVMDQVAAHHRDRPPVERLAAHDRATLVHLLDEPRVSTWCEHERDALLWAIDGGALGLLAIPVVFDVEVPADRIRVRHVDGRVFDHMADGRVVRVIEEERTDG